VLPLFFFFDKTHICSVKHYLDFVRPVPSLNLPPSGPLGGPQSNHVLMWLAMPSDVA
jgi:hypothetical protein